jgi:hypothetical protein
VRLSLLIAPLALFVASAAAQTGPPPLTQEQALTLPPAELADIVFRQIGARMRSANRPTLSGPPNPDGIPHIMSFATAPHATDVLGLCAATVVEVDFEPAPATAAAPSQGTPVRARSFRASEVYKVIGEIEPYAEVSEADQVRENRRCAEAGPVIPPSLGDRARPAFFGFEGAVSPMMALLVLQRAIGGARAGSYRDIGCSSLTGEPRPSAECRDPRALLGGLDLVDLIGVQISPADVSGNRHLIRASFLIRADANSDVYWSLSLEAEITDIVAGPEAIGRLGRAEIVRREIVS